MRSTGDWPAPPGPLPSTDSLPERSGIHGPRWPSRLARSAHPAHFAAAAGRLSPTVLPGTSCRRQHGTGSSGRWGPTMSAPAHNRGGPPNPSAAAAALATSLCPTPRRNRQHPPRQPLPRP
eukprot:3529858-Lingulodinium_polyedra.AAC.1